MNDIDQYLNKVKEPEKSVLLTIRTLIKQKIPYLTEEISYGMPVFKYKGKYLIGYAAFKDHLSIFPGSEPIEVLKEDLKNYKTSKGTIQFTIEKPISDKLLLDIITVRVSSIDLSK